MHILDEFIHHSAEVGLMRDLYRATHPAEPEVLAALTGDRAAAAALLEREPDLVRRAAETARFAVIPMLVEIGFAVDGPGPRTALHHAAGAGNVDAVRTLLSLGADPNRTDSNWHATALGWAEYFHQPAVAALLNSNSPAGPAAGPSSSGSG